MLKKLNLLAEGHNYAHLIVFITLRVYFDSFLFVFPVFLLHEF